MRFAKFLVMSIAGLATASIAQAQQIGTYTGKTADGSSVTITVAQDPNNANLEITLLSFDLSMVCERSKETLHDIGIGLGNGYDIVGGKFSYASANFFEIALVTNMRFNGTRVMGKVGGNLAAFNPAEGHETLVKAVQACISPNQAFTATLDAGAVAHPAAHAAVTATDGRSTISIGASR